MDWQTVFTAALLRAFIGSLLAGLLTGLTIYQTSQDVGTAVVSGLVTAVTTFIVRGGFEGGFDAKRAADGNVYSSDIGHTTVTSTTTVPESSPVVITPPKPGP